MSASASADILVRDISVNNDGFALTSSLIAPGVGAETFRPLGWLNVLLRESVGIGVTGPIERSEAAKSGSRASRSIAFSAVSNGKLCMFVECYTLTYLLTEWCLLSLDPVCLHGWLSVLAAASATAAERQLVCWWLKGRAEEDIGGGKQLMLLRALVLKLMCPLYMRGMAMFVVLVRSLWRKIDCGVEIW